MSSLSPSEKPSTSSDLQKQHEKERECSLAETQNFDEIDKRLEMLLARVTTLERSLSKLNFTTQPSCTAGNREDTDEELEGLENVLNAQERLLSDSADGEDIEEKEGVDPIQDLPEEN
ncbi:uncharacterized protein LOC108143170 [Drosophila elegans]|uniref:uncharacterized protein LOC108143170 n=1 Tax=Drosophila elegans TaxID=30023 RepID=UPI0007E675D8|nr:uncharacterized protein LOC108143170 [Drosophila elegans]